MKFRLVIKSDYSNSIALTRKLKRKIIDTFNKNMDVSGEAAGEMSGGAGE